MGVQDTMPVGNGDLAAQLHRLTGIVIDGQARTDARLDRIEHDISGLRTDVTGLKSDVAGLKTDVACLKTDVAVLKTEMAETKAQLGRLELSTLRRFDQIDARFESWGVFIKDAELKKNPLPPPRTEAPPSTKKRNPGGASGRESRTR